MLFKAAVASLLASALAVPAVAGDPVSLSDQKAQAEIDQIRAGIQNDRVKSQAELLAAIRGTSAGAATAEKTEAGAEALLLTRRLYGSAAATLADAVSFPAQSRPLVIIGDRAPTVADWYAFKAASRRLHENLNDAAQQWRLASAAPAKAPSRHLQTFALNLDAGPFSEVAVAIDAITSVASLFKYDTAITASPLALSDDGVEAIVTEVLATKGFGIPDGSKFDIDPEPKRVEAAFLEMEPALKEARYAYGAYLQRIRGVDKPDNIPPAVAQAGRSLETVLTDYDSARKALYTPVNGVLPANLIDREAEMANNRDRPIVFVNRHAAALTTTTSKNFFTSLSPKVPVFVSAAAEIDYVLSYGGHVMPGSVVCSVARARLPDAPSAAPTCVSTRPAAGTAVTAAASTSPSRGIR